MARKRLRSLAKGYDSYLSSVYKEYLSERKLDIPSDKVDTFNYEDLNKTLTAKPINSENETDILIDKENMDSILNGEDVEDNWSTSGVVKDESDTNTKESDVDNTEEKDEYNKVM